MWRLTYQRLLSARARVGRPAVDADRAELEYCRSSVHFEQGGKYARRLAVADSLFLSRHVVSVVVDIHEFKVGKIVRTWHTEDWMAGLRQLGVFEK
jgi:hypothetical protein